MRTVLVTMIVAVVVLSVAGMAGCATDGKYSVGAWCGTGFMLTTNDPNSTMRAGPLRKVGKDEGTDEVAVD